MGILEGTHLLLQRARRFSASSPEEMDDAINIVIALAQFPLAIDQAGTYIKETRCTIKDYLQLYQAHRHALLARRGKQAFGYPDSVATINPRNSKWYARTSRCSSAARLSKWRRVGIV
ncbi:hypothetical protein KDA_47710 [Dictyobacter alpinus]|uniref:Uncharacterized protein n=1 Tax=Dictyobacter alpinus TaxID=2014873 RepID=A0A402BDD6_9CHLR|nr:hypothetical protein [Dictyobacter alpinus]GCE29287.1 hypothetical protein KDA_47710 [Dictyobacter alpinus]